MICHRYLYFLLSIW